MQLNHAIKVTVQILFQQNASTSESVSYLVQIPPPQEGDQNAYYPP